MIILFTFTKSLPDENEPKSAASCTGRGVKGHAAVLLMIHQVQTTLSCDVEVTLSRMKLKHTHACPSMINFKHFGKHLTFVPENEGGRGGAVNRTLEMEWDKTKAERSLQTGSGHQTAKMENINKKRARWVITGPQLSYRNQI